MSFSTKLNIFPFSFENFVFSFAMRILFLLKFTVSFLFGGEICLCCGKRCFVIPLCGECAESFFKSTLQLENKCKICGKLLISEIEICSTCRSSQTIKSTKKNYPLQTYRIWKKNLLFSWKLAEKRNLSSFFAFIVEQKIRQIESELKIKKIPIVPIPPRPNKIQKIGWDQIEELCFYIKHGFSREILPLLERRTKIQQKKLNRIERLETIGKSYFPVNEKKIQKLLKKSFSGKIPESVILLDDVMTTGATIEDCSKILLKLGVKYIYSVILFIVF